MQSCDETVPPSVTRGAPRIESGAGSWRTWRLGGFLTYESPLKRVRQCAGSDATTTKKPAIAGRLFVCAMRARQLCPAYFTEQPYGVVLAGSGALPPARFCSAAVT